MRRVYWAWFLGVVVSGCGTYGPIQPPVDPPPVSPPVIPPVTPPTAPPASITAFLNRIVVGSTLAEVSMAIGAPYKAPANDGGPPTARWNVSVGEEMWMAYATFVGGKVATKGAVRAEVVK